MTSISTSTLLLEETTTDGSTTSGGGGGGTLTIRYLRYRKLFHEKKEREKERQRKDNSDLMGAMPDIDFIQDKRTTDRKNLVCIVRRGAGSLDTTRQPNFFIFFSLSHFANSPTPQSPSSHHHSWLSLPSSTYPSVLSTLCCINCIL